MCKGRAQDVLSCGRAASGTSLCCGSEFLAFLWRRTDVPPELDSCQQRAGGLRARVSHSTLPQGYELIAVGVAPFRCTCSPISYGVISRCHPVPSSIQAVWCSSTLVVPVTMSQPVRLRSDWHVNSRSLWREPFSEYWFRQFASWEPTGPHALLERPWKIQCQTRQRSQFIVLPSVPLGANISDSDTDDNTL